MNVALNIEKLPPMLQQYLEYKNTYTDNLLLFQVGDFYEAFFDDALTLARVLNVTLTSRNKGDPQPIPMAGVPVAVIDTYLERLVNAGQSVAVVSQAEASNGKGANGKGMVARKLERIVTPGIRILATSENAGSADLVAALMLSDAAVDDSTKLEVSMAFTDIQSGCVYVREGLTLAQLPIELERIAPQELLLPRTLAERTLDRRTFWVRELEQRLRGGQLKFRTQRSSSPRSYGEITGFAAVGVLTKQAVRLLLDYVDETTVSCSVPVQAVIQEDLRGLVGIDATTRATLELMRNSRDGSTRGTLYEYLKHTVTGSGSRLLRSWILRPLRDREAIEKRLAGVRALVSGSNLNKQIREALGPICDLERIAARLELQVLTPRELGALQAALVSLPVIKLLLSELLVLSGVGSRLCEIEAALIVPDSLLELLNRALVDAPPHASTGGGIFRSGYDSELDRLRSLKTEGRSLLTTLEQQERERTGINSLKVRFNNVHGFYIEVTKTHLHKVPEHYTRKQTTVQGERFVTEELKRLEKEVLSAEERMCVLEQQLFQALLQSLLSFGSALRTISQLISELDVLSAFAELAERDALVEPEIFEQTEARRGLEIMEGKHPVICRLLEGRFVPNSLDLTSSHCVVLTGPNMGGKSTYLRQTGLIVIMAQIGSFVPAKRASIGLVDQIFARIGASDDLIEGESTFMVEMREAANIVTRATKESLILIDEIGRGTATRDGLSIAQAVLEWVLSNLGAPTLFATHFHELTELANSNPAMQNLSVGSVEQAGQVVFTHTICKGPASRSYGLEVARLAGIPEPLLERAQCLLAEFEAQESRKPRSSKTQGTLNQLALFPQKLSGNLKPAELKSWKAIRERLKALDLNSTTPLEALSLLHSLQDQVRAYEQ